MVRLSRESTKPGTYKALINVKIAILKENYPEDKLTEEDQEFILAEIAGAFRVTHRERFPWLRSYKLEGGALMYVCTDQWSGQRLTEAINGHRLRDGTMLTATDAKDLSKPVIMALRTRDKQSGSYFDGSKI
jgi:hypothetical protein